MTNRLYCVPGITVLLVGFVGSSMAQAPSRSRTEALREIQELLQGNDAAAAEKRIAEALREFPNDAAFFDLSGVAELGTGNNAAAESAFLKAIELDPLLTGAYLNLGHLYQEKAAIDRDAPRKALAIYEKLLRFEPGNAEANYQSALLLEHQRNFQASLAHLSRLPAADQETAQALGVRCADLAGLGERTQANAAADRLLKRPELTEADILSIRPVLESLPWDALEQRLLEGAVERQLASFDAYGALGRLRERQGRWNEARAALERAARAQPQSVETLLDLARVADKQADYPGALGYIAHARDLDPRNPAIHFFFGMVAMKETLLEEAYKSLKQAVILAPDNAYYNYALGIVAQERADPSEAIPFLKKYCALRPRDPRGRLELGITYFESHQEDMAQKELESTVQSRETAAAAHFFLGRIANQDGKYAEALHQLQQALAVEPRYADPYAEEGIIYMKQKKYVAAENSLLRALAIAPDHFAANLNLMMLYQRTGDKRAAQQKERFDQVKEKRADNAKLALRSIEIVR